MQQQITDIAALVFWINVRNKTFKLTRNIVLSRQYDEIWTVSTLPLYLEMLNIKIQDQDKTLAYQTIYDRVNDLIYNSTISELNILGTTYLDDTVECKTPDFDEFVLLEQLQHIYADYNPPNSMNFEKVGTLLLRTPLPSIVFTYVDEIPQTFVVADTMKALGFQVNLIFHVNDVMNFPPNPYGIKNCVSGFFSINNLNNSDWLWHKIIPNSTCYENLVFGSNVYQTDKKAEFQTEIHYPKFITNANIKKTLFKLDKTNFDYESEIYHYNINYFNLLEKRDLLTFKCLYEFPNIFIKDFYSKIVEKDNFKFVFEENQPAFHSSNLCPNLLSDFENYLIPTEIKKANREIEYRDWFKKNLNLTERKILSDFFKDIHYSRWNCLPLYVDYENSGGLEFISNNLENVEQKIDNVLNDIKIFIESNPTNKLIISMLGKRSYAYNKLETLNLENINIDMDTISIVLKKFENDYKRTLINLLKEYYRLKFNPKLIFERDVLKAIGFRQCKVCNQ